MADSICPHCGTPDADHDYQELARYCYPMQIEKLRAENTRLQTLAMRLSDALLKVRGLGGSEMFIRSGDAHYADPDFCGKIIEEMHAELHELKKEKYRKKAQVLS